MRMTRGGRFAVLLAVLAAAFAALVLVPESEHQKWIIGGVQLTAFLAVHFLYRNALPFPLMPWWRIWQPNRWLPTRKHTPPASDDQRLSARN